MAKQAEGTKYQIWTASEYSGVGSFPYFYGTYRSAAGLSKALKRLEALSPGTKFKVQKINVRTLVPWEVSDIKAGF